MLLMAEFWLHYLEKLSEESVTKLDQIANAQLVQPLEFPMSNLLPNGTLALWLPKRDKNGGMPHKNSHAKVHAHAPAIFTLYTQHYIYNE